MSYKIALGSNNEQIGVHRICDGAFIPARDDNLDYQEYLLWAACGNIPYPCDECTSQLQAPSSAKILADALVNKGVLTQAEIDAVASESGVVFYDK